MLPDYQVTDSTVFTEETAAEVLAVKYLPKRKLYSFMLEVYEEMPVFIPVDITQGLAK